MGSVMKLAVPAFLTAAGLIVSTGVWMALKLRWGVLDTFFNDAWGWAILVGLVLTIIAVLMGLPSHSRTGRTARRSPKADVSRFSHHRRLPGRRRHLHGRRPLDLTHPQS